MVRIVRRTLGWKSVGHAGTLDPSATGVLVILCGDATRRTEEFSELPKEYVARIRFGFATTTYDFEGDVTDSRPVDDWSPDTILDALKTFRGEILQIPPAISAIKVAGRRSYAMARAGVESTLEPRLVHFHDVRLLREVEPEITVLVRCSRGTYVRSLARDLGARLSWGGTLAALARTAVGPYRQEHALTLQDVYSRRSELSGN